MHKKKFKKQTRLEYWYTNCLPSYNGGNRGLSARFATYGSASCLAPAAGNKKKNNANGLEKIYGNRKK